MIVTIRMGLLLCIMLTREQFHKIFLLFIYRAYEYSEVFKTQYLNRRKKYDIRIDRSGCSPLSCPSSIKCRIYNKSLLYSSHFNLRVFAKYRKQKLFKLKNN